MVLESIAPDKVQETESPPSTFLCCLQKSSLQWFAAVRFQVHATFVAFHHVDEICQGLLLIHRNVTEVTADSLCKLSLVEARPRLQLVVPFISPECVYLQLKQVNLWDICLVLGRVSTIITRFSLPFVPHTLNKVLVEVAYVQMSHALVDVQLQLLLRDTLLDSLAEGRISSWPDTSFPVINQATALAIKRSARCRWLISTVLLSAESVHFGRL